MSAPAAAACAGLAIIAVRARSNDVADLEPVMPAVLAALPTLAPGRVTHIPA